MSTYQADRRLHIKELKRSGLTPMDIYTWDQLVLLERLTRSARRIGERRSNSNEFRALRNHIWNSLERKATVIEEQTSDPEPREYLERLKQDIKGARKT